MLGSMVGGTAGRERKAALCALLGLLLLAGSSDAAGRVGVGRMTVVPTRVPAGSTGNELTFTFLADSAPLRGQTAVDVAPGWTKPQRTNPSAPGYIELQPVGCPGTRISAISGRRILITTTCARRHSYRLLYHRAAAPLLSADGYVFLTQTRSSGPRKRVFRPLGPRKQPVVRVRGAPVAGLFMTVTSVATAGVAFGVTVRAVDQFANNAGDYTGTVRLTSTDPAASLPAPYLYGTPDSAQHTFTGVILRTPGTQRITATDSHGFSVVSGPIAVSSF